MADKNIPNDIKKILLEEIKNKNDIILNSKKFRSIKNMKKVKNNLILDNLCKNENILFGI